jgi:hypothetical protein
MSISHLINKSKGIATTKNSNKFFEEEFSTNSTNPITYQDIWYDLDLIPDVAPIIGGNGNTVGVVRYYQDNVMTFVGDVNNSLTFKLVDAITGENLLKSAIYGVNGSNQSYNIVVKNVSLVTIPSSFYNLDIGSGFLTFNNKLPNGVGVISPNLPTISFYKYVGFKGIPTAPVVVNPTLSLSNVNAVYQQNISEPGMSVYYYSLSNVSKTEYRSGYLNINYNNRIATFTDNFMYKDGSYNNFNNINDNTKYASFEVKVINSILYIYLNVSNFIPSGILTGNGDRLWNLVLTNSTLLNSEKNTINDINGDSILSIGSFDVSSSLSGDPNVRHIIMYYTITELPSSLNTVGFNNVRSGILKYTYNNTLDSSGNNFISEETILPLIGDSSLSTSNNVNITGIISNISSTFKLNVNLDINPTPGPGIISLTGRKYKITTNTVLYNNTIGVNAIIPRSNLNVGDTIIDTVLINSTNYINYKYLLQDNFTSGNQQVTTFGELHIIWDNLNNGNNLIMNLLI